MFPSFLLSCRDGGIEAEVTSGKFRLIINVSKCCRGLLVGVTCKLHGTWKKKQCSVFSAERNEIKRCWRLAIVFNLLT